MQRVVGFPSARDPHRKKACFERSGLFSFLNIPDMMVFISCNTFQNK